MTTDAVSGQVVAETTDILIRSLRALGRAGHPDAASRLAARAWATLRDVRPREAERLNGTLHYLAGLPPEADAPPIATPAGPGAGAADGGGGMR